MSGLRIFCHLRGAVFLSLYIVNDVSSRADGKYLENFSTFSKNFFSTPATAKPLCEQNQHRDDESSLGTRIYTLDFKWTQVTTRARPHRRDTEYRSFRSRLPWQRETRQSQVETGHFSKNKFFDGHSPSLMRSLSDGERAGQTVRAGVGT